MMISTPLTSLESADPTSKLPKSLPIKNKDMEAAQKVAKDYETVFLNEMMQHMFAGIKTDSTFGGGHGEDTFRSMLINEYAKSLSSAGGLGISNALQREIIKLQGLAK